MTFNSELAYQVLEQIRLHPEEHTQGAWRCDTGMCFAGWTAEIHGVRWLTDDFDSGKTHYVIVTEDFLAEHDLLQDRIIRRTEIARSYTPTLKEGEVIITVDKYAQALLGLTWYEAGILFAANNSRSKITKLVKAFGSGDKKLLEEAMEIEPDFDDPAEYTKAEKEEDYS